MTKITYEKPVEHELSKTEFSNLIMNNPSVTCWMQKLTEKDRLPRGKKFDRFRTGMRVILIGQKK